MVAPHTSPLVKLHGWILRLGFFQSERERERDVEDLLWKIQTVLGDSESGSVRIFPIFGTFQQHNRSELSLSTRIAGLCIKKNVFPLEFQIRSSLKENKKMPSSDRIGLLVHLEKRDFWVWVWQKEILFPFTRKIYTFVKTSMWKMLWTASTLARKKNAFLEGVLSFVSHSLSGKNSRDFFVNHVIFCGKQTIYSRWGFLW